MIAIQLTDTNQYIDLPPDISLRYEMLFPAFDFDFIQTHVVYNFDFPHAGNESKLNHSHVIQVNRTTKRYAVAFYACGVRIFDGNMYVQSILPTMFSACIVENNVLVDFPETDIREMDWADIDVSANGLGVYAGAAISQQWPDVPVNFPLIKAPVCYGENNESNATYLGYVNNYDRANHVFLPNDMITDSAPPNNQNTLMPWPYLFEVLRQMETFFSVKMIGNILSNADYQRIIISALKLADKGWNRYYCKIGSTAPPGDVYYLDPPGTINTRWLRMDEEEDTDSCWNEYYYLVKQKGYHNVKCSFDVNWTTWNPGTDHLHLFIMKYTAGQTAVGIGYYIDSAIDGHSVFNYEVDRYFSDAEIGSKIIFHMYVERGSTPYDIDSISANIEISNTSTSGFNVFVDTLNVGDFLPEMTVAEFVNRVRLLLGGSLFYDTTRRMVELSDYNSILDSDSIDMTNFLKAEEYELQMLEEPEGYMLKWEWGNDEREDVNVESLAEQTAIISRNSLPQNALFGSYIQVLYEKNYLLSYMSAGAQAWKFLKDAFDDKIVGTGSKSIEPKMAPLRMTFDTNAVLPYINIPLLSALFGTGMEQNSLRLLSFFGVQQDSAGDDFPLASSGRYDIYGNELGNVDLDWNGTAGLYAKCWQNWLEFLQNNETMTVTLQIGITEFMQLRNLFMPQDGTKKIRKIRLANIDYIPEKVSVMFSDSDIWECEAVLRKKGGTTL